jgi:nitrogen PTS system EIIA component
MLSESGLFPRLVDERLIFPDLTGSTVEEALTEMSSGLAREGRVRDADDVARRLVEREGMGSTGLGAGIAIPHCKLRDLSDLVLAIGVSRAGIDFGAPDGVPVTLVFLLLSPSEAPAIHLQALARISRIIRIPGVAEGLRAAPTAEAIATILKDAERQLAVPV